MENGNKYFLNRNKHYICRPLKDKNYEMEKTISYFRDD